MDQTRNSESVRKAIESAANILNWIKIEFLTTFLKQKLDQFLSGGYTFDPLCCLEEALENTFLIQIWTSALDSWQLGSRHYQNFDFDPLSDSK